MIKLPKVCIFTLGCKVNLYDSDAMLAIFHNANFEVTDTLDFADIYIINTCAVTSEAEKKSRQSITRVKHINPNAQIYICGCASQNNKEQFEKDNIQFISGTDNKVQLAKNIVSKYLNNIDLPCISNEISSNFEENDGVYNLKTRHFTKVQDGCNNFCSYCLIPYLRGRIRSRKIENIIHEIESVKDVAKEVIITGINLSAYGIDLGLDLTYLIKSLSKYDIRFRLGSLEVNVINEDFLKATKELKNFCQHFHLSLQSGDDEVLKQMNRHYTTEQYLNAVKLIRNYYPNAAITTDIIVGFPTETEEQFNNSYNFAKTIEFSDIHIFPYSSRKGTVAGKLQPLDSKIISERQDRLTKLKVELINNYLLKQIGLPLDVLFETKENGYWCGHTSNYVKVYSSNGKRNEIKTIIPSKIYKDGLM